MPLTSCTMGKAGPLTQSASKLTRRLAFLGACLWFLSAGGIRVALGGNSTTDAAILQKFAQDYNVAAWPANGSSPCSGWLYIACNSAGRVTQIQLASVRLGQPETTTGIDTVGIESADQTGSTNGEVPEYLDQLDALMVLQLSAAQLRGTLPESWQQGFPVLQQLDLSVNSLSGGVPVAWTASGSFPSLQVLNLQGAFDKNTTQTLPFAEGQTGMANLTSLNLGGCNLTGTLPAAWGQGFSNLSMLTLSNNKLTGQLPDAWGSSPGTSQLQQLMLDSNLLTGNISTAWGASNSFTQLQQLSLAHNQLTSSLPPQWGMPAALPALQYLQLNDNNLTGPLPSSWAQSSGLLQLSHIFLQGNLLTGGVPLSWANNRSSLVKYLRPGNAGMCEPIRYRLTNVQTFGTTSLEVSCLDAGCNQDSDVLTALAVETTQGCVVTVNADRSMNTSAGCTPGTIQINASSGNLSAQYVIANQPALTIRNSVFNAISSLAVRGPATPTTLVNQSAPLLIINTTVHIVDSSFDSNQHFDFGGLIAMNGAAVTISNTRFSNLHARVAGAALVTTGSLVMLNQGSIVTSNSGSCLAGGMLVNADSSLYLDEVAFTVNEAKGDRGGGAVLLYGNSTLHASNSVFQQNAATAVNLDPESLASSTGTPTDTALPDLWCGAINGVPGIDVLYGINDLAAKSLHGDDTSTDPTLGQGGGAIYAASFNLLNLTSSQFLGNTADRINATDFRQGRGAGGAVSINSDAAITSSCSGGIVSITACTFKGNQANSGGAVQLVGAGHTQECHVSPTNTSYGRYSSSYINSLPYMSYSFCGLSPTPYCTISDSSFDSNTASLGGGSLAVLQGYSVQMNNLTFTNSSSLLYGGAVAVSNGSALYSTSCTFTNCSAASGGAVYAVSSSESYLSSVVIPQFRTTFIYASDMYKYIRQLGSALTLTGNTFTGNTASIAGGAVHVSGTNQLVSQGNTFINGRASAQGGAMFLSNACEQQSVGDTFQGNAAQQGGAVAIISPALQSGRYILAVSPAVGASSIYRLPCNLQSALVNATFTDNEAPLGSGGAVYVLSTPKGDCRALLDKSQLAANYAENGGAFFAASSDCFVVQNSNFTGNSALIGGAVAVQSTNNASFNTITAVSNTASWGGGMFVDRSALLQVNASTFNLNAASNGGGLAVQQVTSISMSNVTITGNVAAEHGGAIYSIQPTISLRDRAALNVANNAYSIGDLSLSQVNMSQNVANQGGCMYVTGNGANVTLVNSFFDSCTAHDVAGGLMCDNCPQVYMSQVAFTACQAQSSAGALRCTDCQFVILDQLQFDNNSAIHGGALDINASTPNPVIVRGSDFMSNRARIIGNDADSNTSVVLAGNGGAIRCLGGNLIMIDDTFEDNEATNGAAVYAEQGCGQADSYSSGYCQLSNTSSPAASTSAAAASGTAESSATVAVTAALNNAYWTSVTPNCSQLWLTQTQFAGNKAIGGGGGAIFWNGPVDDLIVSCSELEEAADPASANSTASAASCEDWEGNNSTLGFGGNLASAAAAINASNVAETVISGFASGNVLPSLSFNVIDHFGNLVSGGVTAAEMLVSATSTNAILGGQQLAQARDGVVTFDGLIITANSTMNTTTFRGLNYAITFSAASITGITPWTVSVNIRGCQPGEQYDNNICRECQEQTYSFHPGDNKGQCLTCPDTAHCPGGSIFVPDDGYWHSSFDTDTVQRCPNTFACSYSKSSTASLVASADSERSRLLEACQTAYYNGSTASSIVLDNNGIFADILCIRDDKLGGNASYEDTQCQVGYTGPLCTNCADGYGNSRTFHCNKCMPSVATNTFLIFLGHLASFCYVAWLVRGCLASAAQVGKADGDHFEQFSDMMKVVTTYLQTNGIVAGLNINWPNSLRSIQNIFNVVQSSMVNTVSMDCSLQYWDTPILSQAGFEAVLAMLVPMGMLAIFCLGWTLRWWYLRRYGELTDITGRPISRASSQSSLAPSHDRSKDMTRSNTRDTNLSGSDSDEDDDDMLELQPSPSQKAEDKRFIRVGSSRSEDGSPRSTWEDQGPDEGLIGTQQSRSEDGCPQASWENQPQGLSGTEEPHSQDQHSGAEPPADPLPHPLHQSSLRQSPLRLQLAAAAAASQIPSQETSRRLPLSAASSGDLAYRTDSADSQSPLLSRLLESPSLTEAQLAEELGASFGSPMAAPPQSPLRPTPQSPSAPTRQQSQPRHSPTAPVLAAIHTSSSHPLQDDALSAGDSSPTSSLSTSPRSRKAGSTRFALNDSPPGMSGSFGSSGKASRLGQSALKRGGAAVGSSLSSAKSTKRVQLAAPEKEDELQATEIALDIQEGVSGEEDDHSWPGARPMHRPRAKLVPSKSSMKSASPAGASIKSAASKSRFHSHSSREGLRFSLTPNHHSPAAAAAAGGMLHEDSMGSDHSTLSASFKSFRSIPSRLSQFGTSYSLRWSVTAVQSDEFWAYCKRRFLTTAMVLAYFLYPDMSENIANIFSCYPVEIGTYSDASTGSVTRYYWTQDTTEICFKGNHFWVALLLGVPGVLLVCLGIPVWFAGVLYRKRDNLMDLSLHRTYGFLYQGYKDQYYWWESAILLRNLLLVAVVYLGPAFGVYIQAHIVFLIMLASLVLHAYTRPFKEAIIDTMELVSIGSIVLVMYVSLYFLDVDQGLSNRAQWVLGFVLLVIIVGTIVFFLFCVFKRREVLIALLKSTSVRATRGIQQIRTLVKSDRLRSMVTRSTQRTVSSAAAPSEA